jgi:hypothetical protein
MHGSLMTEGVKEAGHGGTPRASVSFPDLLAYTVTIAIVTFLWLQ